MASLFYFDPWRNQGAFTLNSGMEARSVEDFARHYSRINPFMAQATLRPVGLGVTAERMCPRDVLCGTEFYNDYLRPMGIESAIGVTIPRDAGRCFFLKQMTSRADQEANAVDAARLTRLAPHLARAFRYYRGNDTGGLRSSVATEIFDRLGIGVAVIGERRVLAFASSVAAELAEAGGLLRLSPTGRASLALPALDALLGRMLDRLDPAPPKTASDVMLGTRVTLVRLKREGFSAFFEGPAVVLLMEPCIRPAGRADFAGFGRVHGLTPAELRALAGLAAGQRAGEIAAAAGLSQETVRSQIRSLYAKTGVGSHVELLRLLGGGSRTAVSPCRGKRGSARAPRLRKRPVWPRRRKMMATHA